MYEFLTERFLETGRYIALTTQHGEFGFEWKDNYSGLMAQPPRTGVNKGIVKRPKQGLFDIFVSTGSLFTESGVTHRAIIEGVVENTSLIDCQMVWRGISPTEVAHDEKELEILTVLMLLFFEQEVNWGKESWQRATFFEPKVRTPNRVRPRDMLMGYICQAFDIGIDNIAYWQRTRPTTTTFTAPDLSNYSFTDYPSQFKRYFDELRDDGSAKALMVGASRELFIERSRSFPNNPYYIGG